MISGNEFAGLGTPILLGVLAIGWLWEFLGRLMFGILKFIFLAVSFSVLAGIGYGGYMIWRLAHGL